MHLFYVNVWRENAGFNILKMLIDRKLIFVLLERFKK